MFVVSLFCWSKPVEIWILRAKRTTRVNTVQSDGALSTSGGGARIKKDFGMFYYCTQCWRRSFVHSYESSTSKL